ncbi:MAG: DAK2 domain-containing protein [Desulfosarcina sp.]|nr:DAK2 domain-containing protein [Desulfosarcina sp.]
MDRLLTQALAAGCERVAAWADLLDEINVFPVADGDTGRNLKISLAPLGRSNGFADNRCRQLVASATGNSGNIAAAFLTRFLSVNESGQLNRAVSAARGAAWHAVADPKPGTMLTVFDALDRSMVHWPATVSGRAVDNIIETMDAAVRSTVDLLPVLKRAGVVDAGALGMFIFFEGLFRRLVNALPDVVTVTDRFDGLLRVTETIAPADFPGYCVNTVLKPQRPAGLNAGAVGLGDSVVTVWDGDYLRLHLHTKNQQETRAKLETLGEIVNWQVESMAADEPAPCWTAT